MIESRPRRRGAASAFTRVSFRRSAQQRATEPISVYLIPSHPRHKKWGETIKATCYLFSILYLALWDAQGCMGELDTGSEI